MIEEPTIALLIGRTLVRIDVNSAQDEMHFVCDDGETFVAYHAQDCCEKVGIHDIAGDLQSIIGWPIVEASHDEDSDEWPVDVEKPEFLESFTWTTHRLKAANGVTVVIRWLGRSNGFYGERVYFRRTHPEMAKR